MIRIEDSHFDDNIANWHNPLRHVQYHIMAFIAEGRVHYRLNGSELAAVKGDMILIPKGTCREAKNADGHTHQKYTVAFHVDSDTGIPILHKEEPTRIRLRSPDFYKEKMMLLHRHTMERRPFFEPIRLGILLELLGHACREHSAPPIPSRKVRYAGDIEKYLLQHFREQIPLGMLASLIGRSPNYALAVFKEVNGLTPLEYQHRLRVTAAMELLQNTDLTVAAIADHLGYCDASYFHRMFRRTTGMSPTAGRLTSAPAD